MYYSASTNGFIPAAWKDDGSYSAGRWPADAVLLTEGERVLFVGVSPPQYKQLGSESGRPAWIDLPEPSPQESSSLERAWRDAELSGLVWLRDRHRDQLEIEIETTLTSEQFAELLVYMQALRDWPQAEYFPVIEHRPVAPPWIAEQGQ